MMGKSGGGGLGESTGPMYSDQRTLDTVSALNDTEK